jgi:chromosome segregation ATPase
MRPLSQKHKIALGMTALVIGLAASSFGFGTDENISSSALATPVPTQEERIRLISGEVVNIQNQLIGLEKTLEQKKNDLSVRNERIAEKESQISELKNYVEANCENPSGTDVNLCKKKKLRIENVEKEIEKLNAVEDDIKALIEAKPQVEKILAEKKGAMLIMEMEG